MIEFTKSLLEWYEREKRPLPWRETQDPYPIWLSEVILQQTRINQGLPYWQRFIDFFPTVKDLALASEEEVMRTWQGLGYYSRARNLHITAKHVHENMKGHFPTEYSELIKLKGIGPYTAAAIASICFKEPVPAVDGNVFRFASRYLGVKIDISLSKSRKEFESILKKYISQNHPDLFNQAMMEFGACVCTPQPQCGKCPFANSCYAKMNEMQRLLPVKRTKRKMQDRKIHYIVFTDGDKYLMNKREGQDIWKGLFDFLAFEGEWNMETINKEIVDRWDLDLVSSSQSKEYKHQLTHRTIYARFYYFKLKKMELLQLSQKTSFLPFSKNELLDLPKSKLIVNYLKEIKDFQ